MSKKLKVGVIGATGMVGQRFIDLLANHPWFELTVVAASQNSANKSYEEVMQQRWALKTEIPGNVKNMVIKDGLDIDSIKNEVDFIFCAIELNKDELRVLEENYAKAEIPVVSNNSVHRFTPDVPMVIPEINANHFDIIEKQRKRLGTKRGFIAVKPNCSIQSYIPALTPLRKYGLEKIIVCTYQAISGAGKTFDTWPEMKYNTIPYIGGEEEKTEKEPLKIWGKIKGNEIVLAGTPVISSHCVRVSVENGHMACVHVQFEQKPAITSIKADWEHYNRECKALKLPTAPENFLTYFEENDRPQVLKDVNLGNGMGISMGRLREDNVFDYRFVSLSHNTVRGAAGGAVLMAETLKAKGYL